MKLSEQQIPAIAWYVWATSYPLFANHEGKYVLKDATKIWSDEDLMKVYHSEYEKFQKYIADHPNWKERYAGVYDSIMHKRLEIDFGVQTMKFDKEILISWLIQTKSDRFMWQDLPNQDKLGLFDITTGKFVTNELLESYWRTWDNLISKWWNSQNENIVTKPKEVKKKWVPYKHGSRTYPNNEIRFVPITSLEGVPNGTTISIGGDTNYKKWYVKTKPYNDTPNDRFLLLKVNTTYGKGFTFPKNMAIGNLFAVEEAVYE